MEKTIGIKYNWDLSDYPNLDKLTLESLENSAEERIFDMIAQGLFSGELHFDNDIISVWGWWSVVKDDVQNDEI
jgi:hypothetical protein